MFAELGLNVLASLCLTPARGRAQGDSPKSCETTFKANIKSQQRTTGFKRYIVMGGGTPGYQTQHGLYDTTAPLPLVTPTTSPHSAPPPRGIHGATNGVTQGATQAVTQGKANGASHGSTEGATQRRNPKSNPNQLHVHARLGLL